MYMLRQKHLGHRGGEQRTLGTLAYALAIAVTHKLRCSPQIMRNEGTATAFPESGAEIARLFANLAQPLERMQDLNGEISLDTDPFDRMEFITEPLLEAFSRKGEVKARMFWYCGKGDFQECGLAASGFPREKKGLIRLKVAIEFTKGPNSTLQEDFSFAIPVKVVSLLAPVLSKFAFYVEQAGDGTDSLFPEYNQVSVDAFGNWCPTRKPARPLCLDADGDYNLAIAPTYRQFTEAPRGLVYLGGPSRILLNLARSDVLAPQADSGEGFHFYRDRKGLGYVRRAQAVNPAPPGETVSLVEMEVGVSDDPDPRASGWYTRGAAHGHIGKLAEYQFQMRYSSLFRFYGVQAAPAPTLVLGNVLSSYLLIRGFKVEPAGKIVVLPNVTFGQELGEPNEPRPLYRSFIHQPVNKPFRMAFQLTDDQVMYQRYFAEFNSFIGNRGYNAGLAYLHAPLSANPLRDFPPDDPLTRLLDPASAPPESLRHAIPTAWKPAAPQANDLKKMDEFLQTFRDTDRCAYVLPGDEQDQTLWKALERRGLISQGRLALNGWVFIKKPLKFELPPGKTLFLSSGGFIVEEGDIEIRNALEPTSSPPRKNCLLGLVALKGNIIIHTSPDARVHAACIAYGDEATGGQVIFRGGPTHLCGALAMRRIFRDPGELVSFAGPKLSYFPPLAALPNSPDEQLSERSLLTYQFAETPVVMP